MLRSLTFKKLATATMLLALPLATTGCQSTGGWGWSPPSLSSLNPWRSSTANSSLASGKPSSVPTPPAPLLAGNSGLARNNSTNSGGAPAYNANTYGGTRPTNGYTASTGDYPGRQVSTASGEGYPTGRYNTGGSTAQQGPYGAGGASTYGSDRGAPNYGGAAAATADRRSDPAYRSGNTGNGAWQDYTAPQQNNQPANNDQNAPAGNYRGAANSQNNPYVTGPSSSFAGATGLSAGAGRSGGTPAPSYGGDAYRPGSTARGSDNVQPASFDNSGAANGYSSEGNYPTTSGGDEYQP
jgi:hypothetical protein